MKALPPRFAAALAIAGSLTVAPAALAGSTFLFNANQNYTSVADSPFSGTAGLVVENFEGGSVNSLITAIGGSIKGPSNKTDSVDGDDGNMDGKGRAGSSYSTNGKKMTFKFAAQGGSKPTMAGLVWTDGRPNSMITFRAWDSAGNLIGKIKARLGDLKRNGGTSEDRFFGIMSDEGISKIRINSSRPGFEVDHVQFAYGFSVVPVPPALGLGLAGLAGMGLWRKIGSRKANRKKA